MSNYNNLSVRFKFAIIDKKSPKPYVFLHIYVKGFKHDRISTKVQITQKAWDYKANCFSSGFLRSARYSNEVKPVFDTYENRAKEIFKSLINNNTPPYPSEIVKELRGKGVTEGIVTKSFWELILYYHDTKSIREISNDAELVCLRRFKAFLDRITSFNDGIERMKSDIAVISNSE